MEQINNLNHLFAVINEEGKYKPNTLNKLNVVFFTSINTNTTIDLNSINTYFANQNNKLVSYFIVNVDNSYDIVNYYGIKKIPFFMLFYNKKVVKTLDANIDELMNNIMHLTNMIQEKHMSTINQFTNNEPYVPSNSNNYPFDGNSNLGFPFNNDNLGFPSNNNRNFPGSGC